MAGEREEGREEVSKDIGRAKARARYSLKFSWSNDPHPGGVAKERKRRSEYVER